MPIVPAAAIFDLVASGGERPGPDEGRAALAAAPTADAPFATGRVGAGRGATVGKWRGRRVRGPRRARHRVSARDGDVVVGALVGGERGRRRRRRPTARMLAARPRPTTRPASPTTRPFEEERAPTPRWRRRRPTPRCTKLECQLARPSAHHGLARAIHPSHTRHDGDLAFACATGAVDAHLDRLRVMATEVTAEAVRDAVAYHRATLRDDV